MIAHISLDDMVPLKESGMSKTFFIVSSPVKYSIDYPVPFQKRYTGIKVFDPNKERNKTCFFSCQSFESNQVACLKQPVFQSIF